MLGVVLCLAAIPWLLSAGLHAFWGSGSKEGRYEAAATSTGSEGPEQVRVQWYMTDDFSVVTKPYQVAAKLGTAARSRYAYSVTDIQTAVTRLCLPSLEQLCFGQRKREKRGLVPGLYFVGQTKFVGSAIDVMLFLYFSHCHKATRVP